MGLETREVLVGDLVNLVAVADEHVLCATLDAGLDTLLVCHLLRAMLAVGVLRIAHRVADLTFPRVRCHRRRCRQCSCRREDRHKLPHTCLLKNSGFYAGKSTNDGLSGVQKNDETSEALSWTSEKREGFSPPSVIDARDVRSNFAAGLFLRSARRLLELCQVPAQFHELRTNRRIHLHGSASGRA